MSYQYLTKLEQGHATKPSPDVVDRLAEALRLTPVERQHLHDLAAQPYHGEEHPASLEVTDVQKQHIDNLHPALCGYVDEAWNVLYANAEYARIFRGIIDAGNVLTWFFAVPESRAIMLEWETEARLTVAWLRGLMARRPDNPIFHKVLNELAPLVDFRRMWDAEEILMGRHQPHMLVRDLDAGRDLRVLAQVYPTPDPTQAVQLYVGSVTN